MPDNPSKMRVVPPIHSQFNRAWAGCVRPKALTREGQASQFRIFLGNPKIGTWSSPKMAPKEQANKCSSEDPNGYSWVYDNRKPETGSRNGNSGLEATDGP
jgi:hypothetical protein